MYVLSYIEEFQHIMTDTTARRKLFVTLSNIQTTAISQSDLARGVQVLQTLLLRHLQRDVVLDVEASVA